jgi:hypothetical protein
MNDKRGNILFRQELNSLTPKCDPKCAMIFSVILILIFLSLGLPIIISNNNILIYTKDYTDCKLGEICKIPIKIDSLMKAPVYFYYELNNLYMNHRDFVRSRSFPQLRGEVHNDTKTADKCQGASLVKEIFDNDKSKYISWKGKPLKGDDFANPCGLIAKSYFTDTFRLYNNKGQNIKINETGISNEYDRTYMYKRYNESETKQWIDVENG